MFGEAERVMSAKRPDFQRRDGQFEIINRTCRRCEMENEIDFRIRQKNEIRDVVLNEMVVWTAGQMPDVGLIASDQIIDGNDAVAFCEQTIAQMRPEKSRATGHD